MMIVGKVRSKVALPTSSPFIYYSRGRSVKVKR